jgi:hypothetical protein
MEKVNADKIGKKPLLFASPSHASRYPEAVANRDNLEALPAWIEKDAH